MVNERKLLNHLPEHPLDTNPDLRQASVVRFLRGGEVSAFEAAVDVAHDRVRGIPVDLALDSIPLLHLCKPCVQVAFGQKVSIVASTRLHVSVPDDPVGKHNGLPRQPMHFMMPVIALALKVVLSTWPTHHSDGAVDEADDECQLARYSAFLKFGGAQQRTWNRRGFWQSTGNQSVGFSWIAEQW